jgi:hypothetical protein
MIDGRAMQEALERVAICAAASALDFDGEIGGNCPVQGFGTIDKRPWYFRARGDAWSFDIADLIDGGEDDALSVGCGMPGWMAGGTFGAWPDAGWMSQAEAWGLIVASVIAYRARTLNYVNAAGLNAPWSHDTRRERAAHKYMRRERAYHTTRKRSKALRRFLRLINRS